MKRKNIAIWVMLFLYMSLNSSLFLLADNEKEENDTHYLYKLKTAKNVDKSMVLNKLAKLNWYSKNKDQSLRYAEKALKYAYEFKQEMEIFQALCNMAHSYWRLRNNKRAISNAKKAVTLGSRRNDQDYLYSLEILSKIYEYMDFTKSNLKKLLKVEKKAIEIAKRIKDQKKIVQHIHSIGSVYSALSDYKSAFEYRKKAYQIYKELGDTKKVIQILTYLTYYEKKYGNAAKALNYLFESKKLAEENSFEDSLCRVYYSLGNHFGEKNSFSKAIDFYKRGEKIAKQNKFYSWAAIHFIAHADLVFKQGNYIEAGIIIENARKINESNLKTNKKYNNLKIQIIEGKLLLSKKNYDGAYVYFNSVFISAKNDNEKDIVMESLKYIGLVFYNKEQYKMAIPFLKKSMKIALDLEEKTAFRSASEILSEVYSKLGKHKKAEKYKNSFK